MRSRYTGPKLPAGLQKQVDGGWHSDRGAKGRKLALDRKEKRRTDRVAKKHQSRNFKNLPPTASHNSDGVSQRLRLEHKEGTGWHDIEDDSPTLANRGGTNKQPKDVSGKKSSTSGHEKLVCAKVPRAVKVKITQDDAEIALMEKKLGIVGKKRSRDIDDELDDMLGDLGGMSEDSERGDRASKHEKAEDSTWLTSKRRKALGTTSEELDEEELQVDDSNSVDAESDSIGASDTKGSFIESATHVEQVREREDPFKAPVTSGDFKYLPPALRASRSADDASLSRLKRHVKGLLNRLSETNILTLLRDFEAIYQNNPRSHVNTTLIDLLINMLSDPSVLIDTFLILHAGFVASIYKVIGSDFGAQMVERIVSEIDTFYQPNKEGTGKQTTNLVSLLAELYAFQVIGCNIIFDYVRLFLAELNEINTELLLRIVRPAGSQLRRDDPTSLKDIVVMLQKSVTQIGQSNLSVRTKFMIETISDLKNNRMKTGTASSTISKEHTIRMKKQLGALNSRNLKATEPLRIGLTDIRDTEKKGKWWLVGASWRNEPNDEISSAESKDGVAEIIELDDGQGNYEVDLVQLACEHRMNTDIRRAIFVSIMSASDFKDAQMRLGKLNLRKSQETEIPRVLVHCAGAEESYNHFYTVLARKICSDHKTRKSFQFVLWDIFKSLGEEQKEPDGFHDEHNMDDKNGFLLRKLVNQGKLFGALIGRKVLPITCLKNLNFLYLQDNTKTFVNILLVTAILESSKAPPTECKDGERAVREIFIEVDQAPQMIAGLRWFLKRVTWKADIVEKQEKATIRWVCKSVVDMLTQIMATLTVRED